MLNDGFGVISVTDWGTWYGIEGVVVVPVYRTGVGGSFCGMWMVT